MDALPINGLDLIIGIGYGLFPPADFLIIEKRRERDGARVPLFIPSVKFRKLANLLARIFPAYFKYTNQSSSS